MQPYPSGKGDQGSNGKHQKSAHNNARNFYGTINRSSQSQFLNTPKHTIRVMLHPEQSLVFSARCQKFERSMPVFREFNPDYPANLRVIERLQELGKLVLGVCGDTFGPCNPPCALRNLVIGDPQQIVEFLNGFLQSQDSDKLSPPQPP